MTLKVRLYSDYVWPFCFVAEQGSLVRLQEKYDLEIDWRGFELHPETPVGGISLDRIVPKDQVALMTRQIQSLADEQGAGSMKVGDRVPNTRKALAVTEFAREQGRLHQFKEAAMKAFWREGVDLEQPEELKRILAQAGLDPEAGLAAGDDPQYLGRVDKLRAEAHAAGVTGIPTMFFGDGPPVVGARSLAELSLAAEGAGAKTR